jgi:hypothetical protein
MKIRSKRSHLQLIFGLFLACILLNGCMQRRLTICSNPPGAVVKVDDVEIGVTPVSTSFIYYGTRKIQLTKPGYETLTILQPVRAPWYQWPGIDFVSEHFVPGKIHDDRLFNYNLQPAQVIPTDQLLGRAEQLRQQAVPLESADPLAEPLPLPVGPSPQQAPPDSGAFPQDGRLPF